MMLPPPGDGRPAEGGTGSSVRGVPLCCTANPVVDVSVRLAPILDRAAWSFARCPSVDLEIVLPIPELAGCTEGENGETRECVEADPAAARPLIATRHVGSLEIDGVRPIGGFLRISQARTLACLTVWAAWVSMASVVDMESYVAVPAPLPWQISDAYGDRCRGFQDWSCRSVAYLAFLGVQEIDSERVPASAKDQDPKTTKILFAELALALRHQYGAEVVTRLAEAADEEALRKFHSAFKADMGGGSRWTRFDWLISTYMSFYPVRSAVLLLLAMGCAVLVTEVMYQRMARARSPLVHRECCKRWLVTVLMGTGMVVCLAFPITDSELYESLSRREFQSMAEAMHSPSNTAHKAGALLMSFSLMVILGMELCDALAAELQRQPPRWVPCLPMIFCGGLLLLTAFDGAGGLRNEWLSALCTHVCWCGIPATRHRLDLRANAAARAGDCGRMPHCGLATPSARNLLQAAADEL